MLKWFHRRPSDAVERAKARARERAREAVPSGIPPGSPGEGLVVEEISAEEFLRLTATEKRTPLTP